MKKTYEGANKGEHAGKQMQMRSEKKHESPNPSETSEETDRTQNKLSRIKKILQLDLTRPLL